VHHHTEAEMTGEMIDMYRCPVEIIAHGLPHRVFKEH
jgi:zinc transport system ATP-binding protein